VTISPNGQTVELEYEWIASDRANAPLLVFLHEGLGSVAMWGDWPTALCDAAGCRGLVFSRYGYGASGARPAGAPWPFDYLEQEARHSLPALFQALDIDTTRDKPMLFGHSDGASIALLHAAAFPDSVAGIVVVAPHVFVEDVAMDRIRRLQQGYANSPLRSRLATFHDDPDAVFTGWSNCWLAPEFRGWDVTSELRKISCPTLAVQGIQDQYGTLEQLYAIKRHVLHAELLILDDCRHAPHQEQPDALTAGVIHFLAGACSLSG
jgi:pimeloyl-ACP methyl ester carboxylesterase